MIINILKSKKVLFRSVIYSLMCLVTLTLFLEGCHCDHPSDRLKKLETSKNFHLNKLTSKLYINGRAYHAFNDRVLDSSLLQRPVYSYIINDTVRSEER